MLKNWHSKIETAVEADLEEKARIPGPPWQSLSFRPSHARLPAVVASDFILTPWIVLALHPVRCTYATSSDPFPRRVTDRTALLRCRYRLASTSTAAKYNALNLLLIYLVPFQIKVLNAVFKIVLTGKENAGSFLISFAADRLILFLNA
ncbi:MAG: hypothetical protein N3D12_03310 [Candidatus Methanomethyliaceae archaeon]|nr:hypothetical protein [Candidatus Methanomethyliaceae archaeon]